MSFVTRSAPLGAGRPLTLDEAARSVDVVASTQAVVKVFDVDEWQSVREVLLMSGCQLPDSGRVPLLDCHSREHAGDIVGSFMDIRVEDGPQGPQLVGRAVFSATPDGEAPFRKVAEGHLTDVSIGYEVIACQRIRAGETAVIEGAPYAGPLRVATQWRLLELSCVPIGADSFAKIRSALRNPQPARKGIKEKTMSRQESGQPEVRSLLARLRRLLGLREDPEEQTPAPDAAPRQAAVTDEAGVAVEPEQLDDAELEQLVEDLGVLLDEAEAEQQGREDSPQEEGEREGKDDTPACRGALLGRFMAGLTPGQRQRFGQKLERQRIRGIRELARSFQLSPEQEDRLVASGMSLGRARKQVEDMVAQRRHPGPGFQVVSMGRAEKETFRAAVQDSLLLRCGARLDKPAPGAEELRGMTLREIAREMVMRAGQRSGGDIRDIVGRALTTTDMPQLLVETSRRTLMEAYEQAPETWRDWCETGTATDFKAGKALGLEGDVALRKIPEYGEYADGRLAENAEEYRVETFGRKLVISRQAIINDDLGALTDMPRLYGEACAALVGDVAYAALTDTTLRMGDGKPLFDSAHHNLFTGKGGTPTVENLGAVVTGMELQRDSFGKVVTIQPRFFLAPIGLKTACESFFNTQINAGPVVGTQAQPLVYNPYGGDFFRRIYDRRLDMAGATTWYLAAARSTVKVFFLGGVQAPYIESRDNFDTDGFETKVRMDVGAKALRWITLARATA